LYQTTIIKAPRDGTEMTFLDNNDDGRGRPLTNNGLDGLVDGRGDQGGSAGLAELQQQHHDDDGDDTTAPIIPQVCLAVAKDSRYLAHAEDLLGQLLSGWDLSLSVSMQKLLETILLYSPLLFVSRRRGRQETTQRQTLTTRTPGMAACGVEFAAADPTHAGRKLAVTSIGLSALYVMAESLMARESEGSSTGDQQSLESLKGKSRRAVFDRQRAQMMRQGDTMHRGSSGVASPQPQHGTSTNLSVLRERLRSLQRSTLRLFVSSGRTLAATGPGFGGPHGRAGDEVWDDTLPSTVLWLVRLHSALYLIDGQYPTLLHRFMNLQLRNNRAAQTSRAGANVLQSEGALGLLLASFSLGVLFKIAAKFLFERVGSSTAALSLIGNSTIVAAPPVDHTGETARSCMICGTERKHPSCSIHCGHVFCWHCLHGWIQTRAQACPLCKTRCTAHDVVLLRNYV
jgi:hypothetical protein